VNRGGLQRRARVGRGARVGLRARVGRFAGVGLLLLLLGSPACSREGQESPAITAGQAAQTHELDIGAVRSAAIDGLEATAGDPVTVRQLGLAAALTGPELQPAVERLLARLGRDPELERAADRWFSAVQDGPTLRAVLVEFARTNPDLELSELTAGFVAHVDERLTRPALAEAIAATLRTQLRGADEALAKAMLVEAEGAELLAEVLLLRLGDPQVEAALKRRLGQDLPTLEARLIERLGSPRRASFAVELLGEVVASDAGVVALITIVDHEQSARLVAAALAELLDDPGVRERGETLFGLALAEDLDVRAFERELALLLAEPAVMRAGKTLLTGLARAKHAREQLAAMVAVVGMREGLGAELVASLD
jgi:hypothetical protein